MRLLFLFLLAPVVSVELSYKSLAAFKQYMEIADRSMLERASSPKTVVMLNGSADPVIQPWDKTNPRDVPDALIHDWVGAVFVPRAKVADAVAVLQDVPHYPQIYSGDILSARLESREGNHLKVLFRVLRKNVVTVVLETEYDVDYRRISDTRTQVWSRSTRIAEVDDSGTPNERVRRPDSGWGFLWRLNTYWHLEERDGGLLMECRAVSLTRDIPFALAWIVKPMVTSLPREALAGTLQKTRAAVIARAARR